LSAETCGARATGDALTPWEKRMQRRMNTIPQRSADFSGLRVLKEPGCLSTSLPFVKF
jgi:hypothetical protein